MEIGTETCHTFNRTNVSFIIVLSPCHFLIIPELESTHEFVLKVRDVVKTFPRSVFIVTRYLFAFLNHLSEFSDENLMDPYNLAVCFGPTLVNCN